MTRRRGGPARQRGFALIAVLLVLAVLGIVGAEFSFSMRLEASAVRAYKDHIIGAQLAEAGIAQGVREILADYTYVGLENVQREKVLTFFGQDGEPRQRLTRKDVPLGTGTFSYTISDEQGRLNVNTAPPDRIDRLLLCRRMDKSDRDVIVDSIQDWRDPNEEHRLNGAESEDTYLKLPVPYRSHDANLESVRELLQVKGVTPTLFFGTADSPGLVEDVTVKTPGPVNLNTANARVLCAHGLSDAEIGSVELARTEKPLMVPPGQFAGRGFVLASQTFRIQAEGAINGRVGSRITAIVQKRQGQHGPTVVTLEWTESR